MKRISLDIETYSSVDLSKSSVYRYSEAPDFEILLFGYSVDDGSVQVVDLASGERIPEEILAALTDERVTKWAFNANFERVCLSRYLGMPNDEFLDPAQWRCTMIWSAYLGLPLSLMSVGAARSSSTGPTAPDAGLGAMCSCRTCPRTTWRSWLKQERVSVVAITKLFSSGSVLCRTCCPS